MPPTRLIFYRNEDGSIPLIDWFKKIPAKAVIKCRSRLDCLKNEGYELRRPVADYLGEGIYELRASFGGINYRILFFFHGNNSVVVSHGIIKEKKIPTKEISNALERKRNYINNPETHKYEV